MSRDKQKHKPYEVPLITTEDYFDVYDSAEFDLITGQTDYNVGGNVAGAFSNVKYAHSVIIRTNQTVSIKLNSTANASITVSRAEGSITISRDLGLEISNIFVTNASGNTAAVKILMIP
jgi:hypothetical protein